MQNKGGYVLLAVLVYAIYGGAYLPIKLLSAALAGDVLQLLTYRFTTAAVTVLVLWALGIFKPRFRGKKMLPLLTAGLVYPILYYLCETYGLQSFPSGTAGIMMAAVPVIATLLAMNLFNEYPNLRQWGGIAVSIAGVVVLNLGGGMQGGSTWGLVLICLTVAAAALQTVTIRIARSAGWTPTEITLVSVCMGAVFFASASLGGHAAAGSLSGYFAPLADLQTVVCVLYLGIVSSVGAVSIMNLIVGKLPIAVATGVTGVASVVAVLMGVFVLHEAFSPLYLVGMAAVLAGGFAVSRFQRWEK